MERPILLYWHIMIPLTRELQDPYAPSQVESDVVVGIFSFR